MFLKLLPWLPAFLNLFTPIRGMDLDENPDIFKGFDENLEVLKEGDILYDPYNYDESSVFWMPVNFNDFLLDENEHHQKVNCTNQDLHDSRININNPESIEYHPSTLPSSDNIEQVPLSEENPVSMKASSEENQELVEAPTGEFMDSSITPSEEFEIKKEKKRKRTSADPSPVDNCRKKKRRTKYCEQNSDDENDKDFKMEDFFDSEKSIGKSQGGDVIRTKSKKYVVLINTAYEELKQALKVNLSKTDLLELCIKKLIKYDQDIERIMQEESLSSRPDAIDKSKRAEFDELASNGISRQKKFRRVEAFYIQQLKEILQLHDFTTKRQVLAETKSRLECYKIFIDKRMVLPAPNAEQNILPEESQEEVKVSSEHDNAWGMSNLDEDSTESPNEMTEINQKKCKRNGAVSCGEENSKRKTRKSSAVEHDPDDSVDEDFEHFELEDSLEDTPKIIKTARKSQEPENLRNKMKKYDDLMKEAYQQLGQTLKVRLPKNELLQYCISQLIQYDEDIERLMQKGNSISRPDSIDKSKKATLGDSPDDGLSKAGIHRRVQAFYLNQLREVLILRPSIKKRQILAEAKTRIEDFKAFIENAKMH